MLFKLDVFGEKSNLNRYENLQVQMRPGSFSCFRMLITSSAYCFTKVSHCGRWDAEKIRSHTWSSAFTISSSVLLSFSFSMTYCATCLQIMQLSLLPSTW